MSTSARQVRKSCGQSRRKAMPNFLLIFLKKFTNTTFNDIYTISKQVSSFFIGYDFSDETIRVARSRAPFIKCLQKTVSQKSTQQFRLNSFKKKSLVYFASKNSGKASCLKITAQYDDQTQRYKPSKPAYSAKISPKLHGFLLKTCVFLRLVWVCFLNRF